MESFLLNQLGDRFKHAKLLEVSDGSYLITMDVRLPVFGKALTIEKRDMKSILRDKAGYLLKRDEQKYTSQRNRVGLDEKQESKGPQVAESEAFSLGEVAKNIVYDKKLLQGPTTTKVPMPQLTQMVGQIPSQQRKMVGDHYLAGGNLDSESDIHALQALSGIPSTGFQPTHFDHQRASNPLDESTLKLIYERFLGLLDEDKNATIDDVLRQEDVTRVLSTAYPLVTPQEVEQAVIERLQAEEESAEIQDMIARFYNKFDELHE